MGKKYVKNSKIAVLCIITVLFAANGVTLPVFAKGTGTKEKEESCFGKDGNVYLIQSEEDLRQLAVLVNNREDVEPGVSAQTASYRLTTDVDLTEYCKGEGGWEPIGRSRYMGEDSYFNGTFDGGNHVVSGLYINRPEEQAQGLFGSREDLRGNGYFFPDKDSPEFKEKQVTEIKNLYIKDCNITGGNNTGAVMGGLWNFYQEDYGTINISNCHVTGDVTTWGGGGICGAASSVKDSSFQGTVTSSGNAGGIAGEAYFVEGCYVRGQVSGTYDVGGIGGTAVCVRNSYCIGEVSGYCRVGGITGMGSCITGCYTQADVLGYAFTGGLIGDIQSMAVRVPQGASAAARIQQCFMGGHKIVQVPKVDEWEVYPDERSYNGYIYGFPGVGLDRDKSARWYFRGGLEVEGFEDSFFHYRCQPVLWEEFNRERWEKLIQMPDTNWEDVWADVADNTYPRLKWEEENLFSNTVTVTVKEGDSLSKIAMRLLGDGNRWNEIYRENLEVIGGGPDIIIPGTELGIVYGKEDGGEAPKGAD